MARKQGAKTRKQGRKTRAGKPGGENGTSNPDFLDPRISKALAHAMRVNIMAVASWRLISPSEFAREMGVSLNKASYHFKRLVEFEVLELVRTEPVRGTVKHMYRGTQKAIFAGEGWTQLPKSVQDGVAGAALQDFIKVAARSMESGAFSAREDSFLTWDPATFDELAFKSMVSILTKAREQLLALQDEAAERLAKTSQAGFVVAFALSGFEMAKA